MVDKDIQEQAHVLSVQKTGLKCSNKAHKGNPIVDSIRGKRNWCEQCLLREKLAGKRWRQRKKDQLIKQPERKKEKSVASKFTPCEALEKKIIKRNGLTSWTRYEDFYELNEKVGQLTKEHNEIYVWVFDIPIKGEFVCGLKCIDNVKIMRYTEWLQQNFKD